MWKCYLTLDLKNNVCSFETATQNDHTSTVLKTVIMRGWPRSYNDVPKEAQPYYSFRDELTVVNDIILRGQRFVIPESLQSYYCTQYNYIRDTLALMQLNVVQINACIGIRCIHN